MEIKRKKDGSIEGMTTMGDFVKQEFTDENVWRGKKSMMKNME